MWLEGNAGDAVAELTPCGTLLYNGLVGPLALGTQTWHHGHGVLLDTLPRSAIVT